MKINNFLKRNWCLIQYYFKLKKNWYKFLDIYTEYRKAPLLESSEIFSRMLLVEEELFSIQRQIKTMFGEKTIKYFNKQIGVIFDEVR